MRFSEVCLLSNNVKRLSDFYRKVLGIETAGEDDTRQELIAGDVRLVIVNDGLDKCNNNTNMCLVFDCDDVDAEYERLKAAMGRKLHFVEAPDAFGAEYKKLCFYDIDGNRVYFRSPMA